MLKKSKFLIAAVTVSAMTSGCSNIGTINGVRMNATTANDATYCDRNREVCILAGLAIVGGGVALIQSRSRTHAAPATPAPVPLPD